MLHIASFYKYADIADPGAFLEEHLTFCKSINLKGRILVASEGINGTISGTPNDIERYKCKLSSNPIFSGIEFKESMGLMHPFNSMKIKSKPELVRFEQAVNYKDGCVHISPREFLSMAQDENVVILDARNSYESAVGKFKNAITPDINTFREFPKAVEQLHDKKLKKILIYCTGGIRCEKASAFMKKEGFEQVYQLHGGILNFAKECPDTIWEGKCFVFDKRLITDINADETPFSQCEICATPCDLYKNCSNKKCDKLTITCLSCEKEFGGCCSKECFSIILYGESRHLLPAPGLHM